MLVFQEGWKLLYTLNGSLVNQFGDLLGCGHGPMRIRWHDALCDMLSFRTIVAVRGNNAVVLGWTALAICITLTFCMVSQLILM